MSGQHETQDRQQKRRSTSAVTVILAVLLVIALAVIAWLLMRGGKEKPPDNPPPDGPQPVEKLTSSINLPGYGSLNLKADTAEQELILHNPEENFCQIRISLILEDGTVLWTSELLPPGECCAPVVLIRPLQKGTYNAALKYECFTNDEAMTQLNGAQAQLLLKVF